MCKVEFTDEATVNGDGGLKLFSSHYGEFDENRYVALFDWAIKVSNGRYNNPAFLQFATTPYGEIRPGKIAIDQNGNGSVDDLRDAIEKKLDSEKQNVGSLSIVTGWGEHANESGIQIKDSKNRFVVITPQSITTRATAPSSIAFPEESGTIALAGDIPQVVAPSATAAASAAASAKETGRALDAKRGIFDDKLVSVSRDLLPITMSGGDVTGGGYDMSSHSLEISVDGGYNLLDANGQPVASIGSDGTVIGGYAGLVFNGSPLQAGMQVLATETIATLEYIGPYITQAVDMVREYPDYGGLTNPGTGTVELRDGRYHVIASGDIPGTTLTVVMPGAKEFLRLTHLVVDVPVTTGYGEASGLSLIFSMFDADVVEVGFYRDAEVDVSMLNLVQGKNLYDFTEVAPNVFRVSHITLRPIPHSGETN